MKRSLAGLLMVLAMSGGARAEEAGDRLERVVIVARHGIRSPTLTPAALEAATGRVWPVWSVLPGELTPHGRAALDAMSRGIAARYGALGLFPHGPCADGVFVWADSADDRTRDSGAIMARRLAPGCGVEARSLAAGAADPVFNGFKGREVVLDRAAVERAFVVEPQSAPEGVQAAWARLQHVVAPDGCRAGGVCFASPGAVTWKHGVPHLSGGPALAAMVSENAMLAYLDGVPLVWLPENGPDFLEAVLPAHEDVAVRTRRADVIARPRGERLAGVIGDLMSGRAVRLSEDAVVPPHVRMVVFAGHDTTLDMLGGLFGLRWSFPDLPDPTGPDVAMAFERWRLANGQHEFRVVLLHQGLGALREADVPDLGRRSHVVASWRDWPTL